MGYLRFRRSRSLIPGVRMNLSKSGVSWTFGPRGMHYTVGARGTRATVGVPGTGLSYTAYSHAHAQRAGSYRARGRAVAATSAARTVPRASQPMLPAAKIGWGVVICVIGLVLLLLPPVGVLVLLVGLGFVVVGWRQRRQPLWQVRALLRRIPNHRDQAEQLVMRALAIDGDNPEALGAMANLRFNQGRWQEAGETYEQYLAHVPDDILAVGHAGNAWVNAGRPDRAIPLLVRARDDVRLDEDSRASLTAALGLAYLKQGNPAQALVVVGSQPLQRHQLEEGMQQCVFIRAMAQYGIGHKSRGIADLDRLARLNPAFAHLEETRQEMLTGTFSLPAPGEAGGAPPAPQPRAPTDAAGATPPPR